METGRDKLRVTIFAHRTKALLLDIFLTDDQESTMLITLEFSRIMRDSLISF